MGKNKGFCTMSIKEFLPPYAEEISKAFMDLYERGNEIEADIAKRTLTYAKVRVHLAGIKTKEELDYAIKAGWNVCDFSKWTVEKFKEAGVDV